MKVTSRDELRNRVWTHNLPPMPLATTYEGGRIGWPRVFKYRITLADGTIEWTPWQPTLATHPAPHGHYDKTDPDIRPSSLPWVVEVYDLPRFEALARSDALRDPRHTGSTRGRFTDNRKAPGA